MLLVVALCCALVAGLQASPISPQREIIPLNAEAFAQPEYVQALAKELEKEGALANRRQWEAYEGLNLVRRNLDPIGGGNLVKRTLDKIGGGFVLVKPARTRAGSFMDYQE